METHTFTTQTENYGTNSYGVFEISFKGVACDNVVFLGDVFDKRSPAPECILDVRSLFQGVKKNVFILRGNHDSASKADDGITILSLLERNAVFSSAGSIKVITKPTVVGNYHFIPHYENEKVLSDELARSPKDAIVFGHFGFHGALNNSGDADCDLSVDAFSNLTILGHIHGASETGNIRVLGTPYTTCFQDIGQKFYGIVEDSTLTYEKLDTGPKHLVLEPQDLDVLDMYKDRYTIVRVMVDSTNVTENFIWDLKEKYPHVEEWDIKYRPAYDEEEMSYYESDSLFSVDDSIIKQYVEQSKTEWSEEQLMSALSELRDED